MQEPPPAEVSALPGEKWAPVPGYEEQYLVSTHGRVWSKERVVNKHDGTKRTGGQLHLVQDTGEVQLSKNGHVTGTRITHLVMVAHGPPPPGPTFRARRIDPDSPPHIDNLEWARPITQNKLTEEEAIAIYREAHREKRTQREIADQYGITRATVSSIKHGRTWSHLTKDVNPPASQSNRSPQSKP